MSLLRKAMELTPDVTAACREQVSGVRVVNMAALGFEHDTQRNAALVEEAAAALRDARRRPTPSRCSLRA